MSLVNDLLIELDRNREDAEPSENAPLEGLSAASAPPSEPESRSWGLPAFLALLVAGAVGYGVARLSSAPTSEREEPLAQASVPTAKAGSVELPRVSATRPIALRDVRIKQTGSTTRVEITTDRDADYQIESGKDAGIFNIVLSDTTLREPFSTLDLFGTGIRSIQTQLEDESLRLEFTLDSDSRVQSQRIDHTEGTLLVVDFQPSDRTASMKKGGSGVSTRGKAKTPAPARPAATPFKREKRRTPNMKISRSASDQKRSSQDSARQTAEGMVQAARAAREAGELETAAGLYKAAREASPGLAEAIIEGATTLAELGEVDSALALIEKARRVHPTSPVYLMVHAKILSKQSLERAIALLDEVDLSVEDAPDVQLLAAAYLQKSAQHDLAIERYESILRRYPNRPAAWMGLGISFEARGRVTEAVDAYRIAMQLGELPGRSRGWVSARIDALNEES